MLDVEVALLTAAAQDFFGDDTLDSDVAGLLAPHAAALITHVAAGDPRVVDLARIEVGPSELPRLLADDLGNRVAAALKKIGYAQVTLDLQGYRRGSLNEVAPVRATERAG